MKCNMLFAELLLSPLVFAGVLASTHAHDADVARTFTVRNRLASPDSREPPAFEIEVSSADKKQHGFSGVKLYPTQALVASFMDQGKAQAVGDLLSLSFFVRSVAVIERSPEGECTVNELLRRKGPDEASLEGQVLGSFLGGLIGGALLRPFGPVGICYGAVTWGLSGAVIGSKVGEVGAMFVDGNMNEQKLEDAASKLLPGSSAVVAVFENLVVPNDEEETLAAIESTQDEILALLENQIGLAQAQGKDAEFWIAPGEDGVNVHISAQWIASGMGKEPFVEEDDDQVVGSVTGSEINADIAA